MTPGKSRQSDNMAVSGARRKKYFGKSIHHLDTVASTQDELKELFVQGAPEGAIVIAQDQQRGRGRRDKPWHSLPGRGLWMSVLLQPEGDLEQFTWSPLWAGLVVRQALLNLLESQREDFAADLRLKWPNDVMLKDHKLGGILAEQMQDRRGRRAVILGIGVNLLHRPEDFLPHLRGAATSLLLATGESFESGALLEKMILSLEELYPLLKPINPARIKKSFLSHAWGVGERLSVLVDGRRREGLFKNLGPNGELCLRDDDGKIIQYFSAEQIERV